MALLVRGMKCPICRRPMVGGGGQHLTAFPNFLRGTHSLSALSDSFVHVDCFERWEHRAVFLQLLELALGISEGSKKIRDPEERRAWLADRWQWFAGEAARCDPGRRTP